MSRWVYKWADVLKHRHTRSHLCLQMYMLGSSGESRITKALMGESVPQKHQLQISLGGTLSISLKGQAWANSFLTA